MQDGTRGGEAAAPDFVLDTGTLGAADGYAVWQERFGSVNEVLVTPEVRRGFRARTEAWRLGGFCLTRSLVPAMELRRTRRQISRDGLDHAVLRVMLSGGSLSRIGDRVYGARPGDLVVETLGEPYADSFETGEWVGIYVSPTTYPDLAARLACFAPGPVPGAPARLLAEFAGRLPAHLGAATGEDLPALAEAVRGMVAACLVAHRGPGAMADEDVALAQRLRVLQVIRANLGSARLTPERIAALAGVPRRTLYRLFETEGGVAAHVRALRLERAMEALADPAHREAPIGEVAERLGFHCQASFNRAFRRAYGCTPGEVRLAAGIGVRPALPAGAERGREARDLAEFLAGGRRRGGMPSGEV